jgi:hypothetical protein
VVDTQTMATSKSDIQVWMVDEEHSEILICIIKLQWFVGGGDTGLAAVFSLFKKY